MKQVGEQEMAQEVRCEMHLYPVFGERPRGEPHYAGVVD
jgi:hypothetical protein